MDKMGQVTVRGVTLGEGIPKICVPILGHCEADVLDSARVARECCPDVVEWRADWFDGVDDSNRVLSMLRQLRELFPATPILFTFRSSKEGGERELEVRNYVDLLCCIIADHAADLVDVELFSGEDAVRTVVSCAHANGVFTVGSSHDFQRTPDEAEIVARLERMQALGCDIAKIAVMPQAPEDVLTLLTATAHTKARHPELPLITMSMGQLGMVSRLCGEVFGSVLTFGAAGQASAPGQADAVRLRQALALLHGADDAQAVTK